MTMPWLASSTSILPNLFNNNNSKTSNTNEHTNKESHNNNSACPLSATIANHVNAVRSAISSRFPHNESPRTPKTGGGAGLTRQPYTAKEARFAHWDPHSHTRNEKTHDAYLDAHTWIPNDFHLPRQQLEAPRTANDLHRPQQWHLDLKTSDGYGTFSPQWDPRSMNGPYSAHPAAANGFPSDLKTPAGLHDLMTQGGTYITRINSPRSAVHPTHQIQQPSGKKKFGLGFFEFRTPTSGRFLGQQSQAQAQNQAQWEQSHDQEWEQGQGRERVDERSRRRYGMYSPQTPRENQFAQYQVRTTIGGWAVPPPARSEDLEKGKDKDGRWIWPGVYVFSSSSLTFFVERRL